MKSRTSFFNATVLKKDITRFSPVWGLYTVFTLLYVLTLYGNDFYGGEMVFAMMSSVNFYYGGICALLLFGDLFHARLCNALHAMPMRREGWFLTHFAAGMLFCIAPNLLGATAAAVSLGQVGYLAYLWLLGAVLSYLFFFSVGVFSVMCAGSRKGAGAIYLLVNYLVVLLAWLVDSFFAPALPGVVLDLSWLSWLCPVVQLSQKGFVVVSVDTLRGVVVDGILWKDFGYLAIVSAVGLAFLALALLAYRKRKLETAGDFISLKPVAPVFLVLYTLSVGAALYLMGELFGQKTEYTFLVIGLIIGFFTGCMLLEKRVKVFRKKRFVQFAILLVVFFGTIGIARLDPAGITRYVPEMENIRSVSIRPYSPDTEVMTSLVTDKYIYFRNSYTLTEPEDIEAIRTVHQYCIDHPVDSEPILSDGVYELYEDSRTPLTITYTLKNGKVVQRCYQISINSEVGKTLKPYFSAATYVLGTENTEQLLQRVENLEYYPNDTPGVNLLFKPGKPHNARIEDDGDAYMGKSISFLVAGDLTNSPEAVGLFDAIVADCEEGNLAQLYDYHGDVAGSLSIEYLDAAGVLQYMDITIYTDSANTVAYLKSLMGE